jgi:outer membrane murein-binding lipoprotein Lpp
MKLHKKILLLVACTGLLSPIHADLIETILGSSALAMGGVSFYFLLEVRDKQMDDVSNLSKKIAALEQDNVDLRAYIDALKTHSLEVQTSVDKTAALVTDLKNKLAACVTPQQKSTDNIEAALDKPADSILALEAVA